MNVETLVPRLFFSIVRSWKAQRLATCGTCAYAMHNMQALHEYLRHIVQLSLRSLRTEEKVSCVSDFDNAFIHGAIDSWYGSKEAFTQFVQGPLREELCDLLPSPHLSWTYVAFMVSSAVSYRLELLLSIWRAGADADVLLIYVLVSAGVVFGWLWPSCNGLFFLCDKTCTICTTRSSSKTWLLNWGKTFVVAMVFAGSLIVAEALSIFVLQSR